MLTHYNVARMSNSSTRSFSAAGRPHHGHSALLSLFGFTATLCLPASVGAGVVFHPNPLDSRVIVR